MDFVSAGAKVDARIAVALDFGQVVRPILACADPDSIAAPDIAMQHPAALRTRRFFAGIIWKKGETQ
jgi:hypothetical protein